MQNTTENSAKTENAGGLRGSYTVEASVVICMLFWVMGALMIVGFYMHDRGVLQAASCEAAAAGRNFATSKERSAAAEKVRKDIGTGRLMGSKGITGSVSTGGSKSYSKWTAAYPVPGFAARFLWNSKLSLNLNWTCRILNSADLIRKIRGVGEFVTGGES